MKKFLTLALIAAALPAYAQTAVPTPAPAEAAPTTDKPTFAPVPEGMSFEGRADSFTVHPYFPSEGAMGQPDASDLPSFKLQNAPAETLKRGN